MFDYVGSNATATRLIENFGATVQLVRPGATAGDEWNPRLNEFDQDLTVKAVDLGIKERLVSGTLTRELRRVALIAATGTKPAHGDKISLGGVLSEIIEVRPLSPAGVDVLYEVELTK